jgi:hypothetical protein
VLARQRRSGLSIRQFCLREGFSEPSFYWWRRELAGRPARTTRATIRRQPAAARFASVSVTPTLSPASHSAAYEVVLSDGVRVLVHTTAGEKLGDVLAALRASTADLESRPC